MKAPFTGGCLCGQVRYDCSAAPILMGNCRCHDCQRAIGTAFAAAMLVPCDAVTIAGEVKYHEVIGDSGATVGRGFCPNCGSRLFSKPPNPQLWAFSQGASTIRVGFNQEWTFTRPAHNRGIT
jgi:hypothetical protein